MAPTNQFRRSTSVPNNMEARPQYMSRSLSVANPSAGFVDNLGFRPVTGQLKMEEQEMLKDAGALLNTFLRQLAQTKPLQGDINDALILLPEMRPLLQPTAALSIGHLDDVLDLLDKMLSYIDWSPYHHLSIFLTKCKKIIMQVRSKLEQVINSNLENQQQQQQLHADITINSPQLVMAAGIILTHILESVTI